MKQASKALIYDQKEYLMQLRDNDPLIPYSNHWSFFGGGINNEETPWEALKRELKEELNWQPNNGQFLYEWIDRKTNSCNHIFAVPFVGDRHDLILLEGQALHWFTLKEIQENEFMVPSIENHIVNFNLMKK